MQGVHPCGRQFPPTAAQPADADTLAAPADDDIVAWLDDERIGATAALRAAQLGDVHSVAYADLILAMTLRAKDEPALEPLFEALAEAETSGDRVLEVEALRCLAWQDRDAGETGRAQERLSRPLRQVQQIPGAGRLVGYVQHDLASY